MKRLLLLSIAAALLAVLALDGSDDDVVTLQPSVARSPVPVLAIAEAFRVLDSLVEPADRERFGRILPESTFAYHFSLGLFLRNGFLRDSAGQVFAQYMSVRGHRHRDDMSSVLLDLWSSHVRGQSLDVEGAIGRLRPPPVEIADPQR